MEAKNPKQEHLLIYRIAAAYVQVGGRLAWAFGCTYDIQAMLKSFRSSFSSWKLELELELETLRFFSCAYSIIDGTLWSERVLFAAGYKIVQNG